MNLETQEVAQVAKQKANPDPDGSILDYRYDTTRKNIPPAGLAAQGKIAKERKQKWEYNPHLPPVLRFDQNGEADELPELLRAAGERPLTPEELQILADALRRMGCQQRYPHPGLESVRQPASLRAGSRPWPPAYELHS